MASTLKSFDGSGKLTIDALSSSSPSVLTIAHGRLSVSCAGVEIVVCNVAHNGNPAILHPDHVRTIRFFIVYSLKACPLQREWFYTKGYTLNYPFKTDIGKNPSFITNMTLLKKG